MFYTQFPKEKTWQDKQACRERQQAIERFSPVQQKKKRVVLYQPIGDYECTQLHNSFAINGDWILSVFPRAVCEDIHKFQSFYCKEADGCINQKKTTKDDRSSNQHKQHRYNFDRSPAHAAYCKSVNEHDQSLQDAPDTGKLDTAAEN